VTPTPSATPTPTPTPTDPTVPVPTDPTPTTPTPTPPAQTGFPGASNTGVPSGTTLTDYTGSCTISSSTTITGKTVRCGTLAVRSGTLTLTNSKVIGSIDSDSSGAAVKMTDVEVDAGSSDLPAVGYQGITAKRVNIHGGAKSFACATNCNLEDSWLHGQFLGKSSSTHINGYLSNGGHDVVLRHNSIACDVQNNSAGGGCTGPAAIFGDFSALKNYTFDKNLFVSSTSGGQVIGSYCIYAGYNPDKPYGSNPSGVVVTNNVFERGDNNKCAAYGPTTSFKSGNGNAWSNNTWDNGGAVNP
jgi:hypothetical protein